MSFSNEIKNEIIRYEYTKTEKAALLSGLIKINGTLSMSNKGVVVEIRTENAKTAKMIFLTIQELYKIDCRLLVAKKNKFNKNSVYVAQIKNDGLDILSDLEISENTLHVAKKINKKETIKDFVEKFGM